MSKNVQSSVMGYHYYKSIWVPVVGERLQCQREPANSYDRWAVAVLHNGAVAGHVPREISKVFSRYLDAGYKITAVVSSKPENRRRKGMEVPVCYEIRK